MLSKVRLFSLPPFHLDRTLPSSVGSALDVTTLIDFLPSYLYPRNERIIDQWGIAGFSLGGHSTWIAAKAGGAPLVIDNYWPPADLLAVDPRLEIVIPIVGCPDYLSLMSDRATRRGVDASDPTYFPPSLVAYVRQYDPVAALSPSSHNTHTAHSTSFNAAQTASTSSTHPVASNPFLGKKILAIAGGKDPLVPWQFSAPFFEQLLYVGSDGVKENFIDEDAAHEWTEAMGERMAQFVERWCLL